MIFELNVFVAGSTANCCMIQFRLKRSLESSFCALHVAEFDRMSRELGFWNKQGFEGCMFFKITDD